MGNTGWFADVDNSDNDPIPGYPWQPCIQLDGMCLDLDIWFETAEACEDFIREHLIGQEMLDD